MVQPPISFMVRGVSLACSVRWCPLGFCRMPRSEWRPPAPCREVPGGRFPPGCGDSPSACRPPSPGCGGTSPQNSWLMGAISPTVPTAPGRRNRRATPSGVRFLPAPGDRAQRSPLPAGSAPLAHAGTGAHGHQLDEPHLPGVRSGQAQKIARISSSLKPPISTVSSFRF